MAQPVDSRALRRYVVRIHDVVSGSVRGTGFFVAPGKVLTCAHVVESDDEVDLVSADDLRSPPRRAKVCARSEPGEPGQAPWPFPDLAVLNIDDRGHPCPPLHPGNPDNSDDCHAYGFPPNQLYQMEDPRGSGRTFKFESIDGVGYLVVKQGQVSPGLSGAPLLCPVTRAIVGVVVATREAENDLGGWAAPIAPLLDGEFRIGDDLATQGRIIAEQNPMAAVVERRNWQQVLPVPMSAKGFEQRWAEFKRQRKSSPSDLLLADFGVVPYLFRDTELHNYQRWCEAPQPMAILLVPATGGGGKNRFAIELCKRMIEVGWVAGFWRQGTAVAHIAAPRLIVVDYAEHTVGEYLSDLFTELRQSATAMTPVRLLILSRQGDSLEHVRQEASASIKQIIDAADETEVASSVLQSAERTRLYIEAFKGFSRAWDEKELEEVAVPDLCDPRYETPLDVLFEAFDRFFAQGHRLASEPGSPVDRVLDHERRHWARGGWWRGVDPTDAQLEVAVATLAGASDEDEAEALMRVVYGRSDSRRMKRKRKASAKRLSGLYKGNGYLKPLRPDRLGEALVGRVLYEHDDASDLLVNVMMAASDAQLERTLEVLDRVITIDTRARKTVADAVLQHHDSLVTRARSQAKGSVSRPGSTALIAAITRLLTGVLAEELTVEPGERVPSRHLETGTHHR